MTEHEHKWSEWRDDTKPINIKSQDRLILLSMRFCTIKGCEIVQPRIGKIRPPQPINNKVREEKTS